MWLKLALYSVLKIFFTWDIYAVYFTIFCIFYPPNHLSYFAQE